MRQFKGEQDWTPRECRERLHQLIVRMNRTEEEEKEMFAIKDYLRSMGKD